MNECPINELRGTWSRFWLGTKAMNDSTRLISIYLVTPNSKESLAFSQHVLHTH